LETALETPLETAWGTTARVSTETEADRYAESVTPAVAGGWLAANSPEASLSGSTGETSSTVDLSEIGQIKAALEKRRRMFLVTAIEGARHASVEGNELCLEFAPDARHLRDTLAKSENVKILREVCKEISARDLGMRFVIADGEAGVSGAPISREETERREQQTLRETAEKDPVVQQMLRTFRGEIVDVKRVDGKS
jgi:hypothetical protein